MEALYEENVGLIQSRAWHFVRTNSGVNYSDLESLGNELFRKCVDGFDPSCGTSFSSYLFKTLTNEFARFVNERDLQMDDHPGDLPDVDSMVTHCTPERSVEIRDELAVMGDDARTIAGIFLDSPAEILRIAGTETPREIRGILIRFLHIRGWGWNRIYKSLDELKQTVRSL